MGARQENPALLTEYDPAWSTRAARHLADIRAAMRGLVGVDDAAFDDIGSTSVPGLVAKPYPAFGRRCSCLCRCIRRGRSGASRQSPDGLGGCLTGAPRNGFATDCGLTDLVTELPPRDARARARHFDEFGTGRMKTTAGSFLNGASRQLESAPTLRSKAGTGRPTQRSR